MNILIIEDDVFLAEKIKNIFISKIITNRVQIIHNKESFYRQLSIISNYDIILTDIKLSTYSKNHDGYEIIKIIREKDVKVPIVVISGNSEVEWLRYAFECGASDYIIKPIRLKELEVRVLNWYKNFYLSQISFLWKIYSYKELSYHMDTNEFYFKEIPIPLTKNNKYILSLFFSHPERILTENYLIEKIWWDMYLIVNRSLRVNILRLKRWLQPFWIHTRIQNIRGEWYVFSSEN